jgi:hypothetical protein
VSAEITTGNPHGMEPGMTVVTDGKEFKVIAVPSRTTFVIRRTFRQWLSDAWDVVFFWWFG